MSNFDERSSSSPCSQCRVLFFFFFFAFCILCSISLTDKFRRLFSPPTGFANQVSKIAKTATYQMADREYLAFPSNTHLTPMEYSRGARFLSRILKASELPGDKGNVVMVTFYCYSISILSPRIACFNLYIQLRPGLTAIQLLW